MFGEEGERREEPGEAEGGAAAGTERERSPGRKTPAEESQRRSLAEERAGLPEEAPGPGRECVWLRIAGDGVLVVWAWLPTEANKKGRRRGTASVSCSRNVSPGS